MSAPNFAFVWKYVGGLTSAWHDGGGVLVVAHDVAAARDAVAAAVPKADALSGLDAQPDHVFQTTSDEPLVVIFPDAGCC